MWGGRLFDRKAANLEAFAQTLCSEACRHMHASLAHALRAALREDPDVIMVGEMRDLETISLAITAAETGHLVLATLHTGSAARTLDRILDVFPTEQREQIRIMVGESLRGVISQQLVPKKGALFTLLELKAAGYTVDELKNVGYKNTIFCKRPHRFF